MKGALRNFLCIARPRRFGLEDGLTRVYTFLLLFIVLLSIYPLKFLFGAFHQRDHPPVARRAD